MKTAGVFCLLFLLVLLVCSASPARAGPWELIRRADELEKSGNHEAAFLTLLAVDGAEYRAVRLARRDPMPFLYLLGRTGPEVPAWRNRLMAADLLLALGKTDQALTFYRGVAEHFTGTNRYPVEPARNSGGPVRSFGIGPGSHRDNWLIRRFLALGEMADAAREFERLRMIHQPEPGRAFSPSGLLFTLDHAFFLLRTDRRDEAHAALAVPILVMDMDRVRGRSPGLTRKEFIRLSLGVLTEAGQAERLVSAVEAQVRARDSRAYRVLAEIRRQQERSDEAWQLEFRYLAEAELPEMSRWYRKGLSFEAVGRIKDAAHAYEQVLAAPWSHPVLPDREPRNPNMPPPQQSPMMSWYERTEPVFKAGILARLTRLYGSLGQTEDMLRALLLQVEIRPIQFLDHDRLDSIVERFEVGGHREQFDAWARELAGRIERPDHAANLYFAVGDYAAAAQAVGRVITTTEFANASYLQWIRARFRAKGEAPFRLLLDAAVKADPADARSRLELLLLDDDLDGEEIIAVMNMVLTGKARYDYRRPRGKGRSIDFGSPFNLALRFMRLCEQHGRTDDIVAIGLLIASGEEPFLAGQPNRYYYEATSGERNLANACLARSIGFADPNELATFETLLAKSPWKGALAQVRRRRSGGVKFDPAGEPFGWANLPDGVTALASDEFVLTLASDEKYVYAGMPYGIAVYDHAGNAVTRVALADCGLAIAACDGVVWVGGTGGLFRIVRDEWTVGRLRLDRDLTGKRRDDEYHRENRVFALALDDDLLWIAVRGTVQVLDTKQMTLKVFSRKEVRIEDHFVIERDYIWADDDGRGIYRYERSTGIWTKVPGDHRDLVLIGDVDGELMASVNLGDPIRRRPCIIDRETLAVTPIFFESPDPAYPIMINHELSYFGTLHGLPVLGPESPRFVYDPKKKRIRRLPGKQRSALVSEIPPDLRSGDFRRHPDGRLSTDYKTVLTLANGTKVVGQAMGHTPRYKYRGEDWPFSLFLRGRPVGAGGLTFMTPDGEPQRVSSVPRRDSILGPEVLCMTPDGAGHFWYGTTAGVFVLDREFRVVARFTAEDGILTNRVDGAAAMGGKLFFASGWGGDQGGLTVFDPVTSVFHSLLAEDGLPVSNLIDVSPEGSGLLLTPGVVLTRASRGRDCRLIPPFLFDPERMTFSDPGPGKAISERAVQRIRIGVRGDDMPILDGRIIVRHDLGDHRLILGTRGVLIVPVGTKPALEIRELEVPVVRSRQGQMMADAKKRRPEFKNLGELERLLDDENPWFRAKTLQWAGFREKPEFVPVAARYLDDEHLLMRASALYLLTRIDEPDLVVPYLTHMLGDPDPWLRAHATIQLCRHGAPPDPSFLLDILKRRDGYPALPSGVGAGKLELYEAVAPHATPAIFKVLLINPLGTDDYETRVKARQGLGESLRRYPGAVPILMTAKAPEQIRFVRAICGNAGPTIMPALLDQLSSDDRVRRSNAALALGAVGDPAAIPHLLHALGRESGLSRAAAVRALGDLKAEAALPRLTELYVLARSDPGGGYRAGQAGFGFQREYERIEGLGAIAREWDELTAAVAVSRHRPGAAERLVTPELILDSIRRIGPEASQEFYRRLAGDASRDARQEAAIGLAACTPEGTARALRILENLLMDADGMVRAEAAVSLTLLGRENGRAAIMRWLKGDDDDARFWALRALRRIRRVGQIEFALESILKIERSQQEPEGFRRIARKLRRNLTE